jgi:Ca-activated chloride channel family protein
MKHLLISASIVSLVFLACIGCDQKPRAVEAEAEQLENTGSIASSAATPADHEPIRNTSPDGSSMDPSSNAIIVFDGSGSMAGEPIEQAKRAVSSFVARAPQDLNIGLVVFDSSRPDGKEVLPLGRGEDQRRTLTEQIRQIKAGGGTPLGSAIKIGTDSLIKQFQKQLRYGDIRLIVVTDGAASDMEIFSRSIQYAQAYHVPLYTIGFRIQSNHPLRQYSESYFTASDEAQLLDAMEETLAELDDSTSLDL